MPRFVVLEHRWNGIHFDLMLERDGALRTWSLGEPLTDARTIAANPLPDHRLVYLLYEGPISGDRGFVKRLDSGTYEVFVWREDRIEIALQGDQLKGKLVVWRTETGEDDLGDWSVRFGNRD